MDRNNLLVRTVMLLTINGFLAAFLSCSKLPPLMSENLVGQWESNMNEVLILYADSTFEAKDVVLGSHTANDMFNDDSETRIGGKGTWRIYKNKLCLSFSSFDLKNRTIEMGYNFTLSVRGSGLLENRLPWIISGWLIDDEEFNTFKKVE